MDKPKNEDTGISTNGDAALADAMSKPNVEVVHINDDTPMEVLSEAASILAPVLNNLGPQPRNRAKKK